MFKDELRWKILKEFCVLRAKAYAYLMDDDSVKKKAKGTKKCVIKRQLMFENYTDFLFNDKIILKSQQVFRSDHHNVYVYTVEINKIVLSSKDDNRLQTLDRVTAYPHRTNAFKCAKVKWLQWETYFLKAMIKSYCNHNKGKRLQM